MFGARTCGQPKDVGSLAPRAEQMADRGEP